MKQPQTKKRLDHLLSERRPDLSRNRIRAEIMAGNVFVDGKVVDKPGTMLKCSADIQLQEAENPYVSRGGLKLEGAIEALSVDVDGLIVLDVGASTGGFTDCLLKKGAKLAYALDVGYGQLAFSLRNDPRVVAMERHNVRDLKKEDLSLKPDLAVVDVSFISLTKVIPVLYALGIPLVLALVKPQFEAGRADADRGKGVIRDPELHSRVLNETAAQACKNGYCCAGMTFSKWPGPKGNIEYFIYLKNNNNKSCGCLQNISEITVRVVEQAHRELKTKGG